MISIEFLFRVLLSVFVFGVTATFVLVGLMSGPFVPTSRRKVSKMLDLARVKKGETLVDLGAGDGRFVIAAAQRGLHAVGVEKNPFLILWARCLITFLGLSKRAQMVRGDLFDYELGDANVLVVYLFPETHQKLQPKLEKELKPGARVLTNTFAFPEWSPITTDEKEGLFVYQR